MRNLTGPSRSARPATRPRPIGGRAGLNPAGSAPANHVFSTRASRAPIPFFAMITPILMFSVFLVAALALFSSFARTTQLRP